MPISYKSLGGARALGYFNGKVIVSNNRLRLAPLFSKVFVFRNKERGQIAYSLRPALSKSLLYDQFVRTNWQNRKPQVRDDLWTTMCVMAFENDKKAVSAFKELLRLKMLRDTVYKKEVNAMRPKNEEGNVWYSAQFRPVYAQEAVADMTSVIDYLQYHTMIFWEDEWRRGADKHWNKDLVQHELMDRTRIQHPEMAMMGVEDYIQDYFRQLREHQSAAQAPAADAAPAEEKVTSA